jgi:predicted phosphodiesterase
MKLGFISDIHEDIQSLEKAFRVLSDENCETIICLGDIIGFTLPFYRYIKSRNAEECIRLVRENCSYTVAGNHDLYAIKKIPEYKAGFDYVENWYQLEYEIRAKKARNRIWLYEDNEIKSRLSDSAKEFLQGLKEIEFVDAKELRLTISHFCYPDFSGSAIFFPSENYHLQKHFNFINSNKSKLSFSGHGHPDGAILVDEDNFRLLKFGLHKITESSTWLIVPCVARTTRPNGIVIFDSEEMMLNIIPLSNL